MFKTFQSAILATFFILIILCVFLVTRFFKVNISQVEWTAVLLAGAGVLGLSTVFARSFSRPIERLAEIADKIAAGEFPRTIIYRSRFEVGRLERSIEKMSQRLAENFSRLADEKSRMAAILTSMAEGVLATDQFGKIILVNPAAERMFGLLEPKTIDKTMREAIRNNEICDLAETVLVSGKLIEKEVEVLHPAGGIFFVQAGPIKDKAHNLCGAVIVAYDVTEIRRLEKHRSEFVANVSHELKTPLTVIRGAAEALLQGAVNDPAACQKFLVKIENHAKNLSVLIDDILEISRLESKIELGKFVPLNLPDLVRRAWEVVEEKAQRKNISIDMQGMEPGQLVFGIEEHLYRAILNLLDNAVNYTGTGGKIDIVCTRKDQSIEIVVIDSGIGIPSAMLPRLFERFFRVDQARSRDLGGTGLGLAIVKHVMNIHGGSVTVESEEGKGSKFTLVFPLTAANHFH